jgi:PIN domain nuclease of toxin-antitoxin system
MRLLLDTHIFLWTMLEPRKCSRRTARAVSNSRNEIWVSPISTWEIMILARKGRLRLDGGPSLWLPPAIARSGFREAPLTHEIALGLDDIVLPHGDPSDRLLAATARVNGLTLLTADENLLQGKGFEVLSN